MNDPIYREYSCNMSQKNCVELIRALAMSGASITSNFTIANNIKAEKLAYCSMFFMLRFRDQSHLDKFHSFGLQTKKAARLCPD